MYVRVLALLLTVSMALCAVGLPVPTVLSSSDMVALVDDGVPDVHPAIAEAAVVVEPPQRDELTPVAAPLEVPAGRLHEEWVFRPPRAVASR